jgi:resuscitation-promoting factor RpfB
LSDLFRRAAALTILAAVGIALLAPMAARSVAPVPADEIAALLPAAPLPVNVAARGVLSDRRAPAPLPVTGRAESVAADALPTPASAPMEATLYPVATPKPTPAPRPPVSSGGGGGDSVPVDGSVWDRLAQCESGGNWSINTGNGYYGGLQFSYSTWLGNGGGDFAEYAHLATREQQILIAENLHARRGFQPWPACRAKLGLP